MANIDRFYGDKRFSDFTVICHGKEYHVHRVLVSTQSKWFEACCTAYVLPQSSRRKMLRSIIRPFKEAADRSVTLHEDDPVAIERMFEFFYQGTYYGFINSAYPDMEEKGPSNSAQLHAYVYVVAEKYDCPALRLYALENFAREVGTGIFWRLKSAAFAVYQQVELPESNRTLKTALLEGWVTHRSTTAQEHEVRQLFKDVPEFAEDLAVGYLKAPNGMHRASFDSLYATSVHRV